jgi:flagellar hook protein FlgE
MFTSFNTALSALNADTTAIDVVGNNLANLNTPGFKSSELSFSDLVSESMGVGTQQTQVGFGVANPTTIQQFSQGAIESTSNPLDVAIQGNGFLVVQDPNTGQTLYTRGGSLETTGAGELVTANGYVLQGWNSVNGAVNTNLAPTNVVVPLGSLTASQATANTSITANLDANAATGTNFSTSIQVYDSLGDTHTLTIQFSKTANSGEWSYAMSIPGADLGQSGSQTQSPATGLLEFDQNGNLTSPTAQSGSNPSPSLTIQGLSDGAAATTPWTINWNLYNAAGQAQLTSYAQNSSVAANSQDGSPSAQLTNVSIGNGGTIISNYSDGQQVVMGQLAMANISNPESLVAAGNNNYELSASSALPAVGGANSGGRGQILGESIESSTVDIATEFTNLIVYQRSYEANSKVITSSDQLSQDTINLIRS